MFSAGVFGMVTGRSLYTVLVLICGLFRPTFFHLECPGCIETKQHEWEADHQIISEIRILLQDFIKCSFVLRQTLTAALPLVGLHPSMWRRNEEAQEAGCPTLTD